MKFNLYVMRKLGALFLCGFLPAIVLFATLITTMDLMFTYMLFFVSLFVSVFIAGRMVKHALSDLIEGKGLLTLALDSTGRIDPFIVDVNPPLLMGKIAGRKTETLWDRAIAFYLAKPKKTRLIDVDLIDESGRVVERIKALIMPTEKEKDDYLFAFGSFPCFIYNKVLDAFLPKSVFSNFESNTFIRHYVLYLLKKTEELSTHIRDFARMIIEATRPKESFWAKFTGSKLFWIVIIGIIIIIALIFGPLILDAMSGASFELPSFTGGDSPLNPRP